MRDYFINFAFHAFRILLVFSLVVMMRFPGKEKEGGKEGGHVL